jgi:hypothetical protein
MGSGVKPSRFRENRTASAASAHVRSGFIPRLPAVQLQFPVDSLICFGETRKNSQNNAAQHIIGACARLNTRVAIACG